MRPAQAERPSVGSEIDPTASEDGGVGGTLAKPLLHHQPASGDAVPQKKIITVEERDPLCPRLSHAGVASSGRATVGLVSYQPKVKPLGYMAIYGGRNGRAVVNDNDFSG
jgi:hypothetical protein